MTVVHVGTTKKYAAGWQQVFGSQDAAKPEVKPRSKTGSKKARAKKPTVK
jgi:hypothetical protein